MSKTETWKLQQRFNQLRITRQKKTAEYRTLHALLIMGGVMECRGMAKVMETGNEDARLVAELLRCRKKHLIHQLRRV